MKIKRYFAPDIKQAIRMVREEQGPDAVILSNRKVDGGVEIVAAQDFDEQALLDRGKPQDRPAADPQDFPAEPRATADAKRRAEDAFREALGKYAPDTAPARAPEPAPRRAEFAQPTAPASRPQAAAPAARPQPAAYSEPGTYREPVPNPSRSHPGLNLGRGLLDEIERAEQQPAPRRPERPAPEARPNPSPPSRPAERPQRPAAAARFHETTQIRHAAPETSESGQVLRALQREMRQMRQVLDSHLGESRWNAEAQAAPTRLDLLRGLGELGFSKKLSLEVAERAGYTEDFDAAWRQAQEVLARRIPIADDNLLEYGGVVALVGPTGVGKTTTIAKLAARFRMKHGSRQVALITTDNYRIGAQEQLGTYGRILDVPVRNAGSIDELRYHLAGFHDRRLVLIDTAGMGPRDMRLAEQIALFARSETAVRSYLVLSAASQYRAMREAIEAFGGFAPEAAILTKLDETAQLGTALSALIENRLPLAFLCDGQQVPEDLHQARPHVLLDRCFTAPTDDADLEHTPLAYEDWVSHANF
ncbi:flagellar biosynthesis protein FlhF [Methylomagnum ishizawai]|uniref:Flagellar biosynthesis protein FlhF n=1 Tax=Methylomagnum ishizawai TaxID=1760988 RepID=A0A1Y6CWB9_9GAMM|nr:flagellar biosynthesis protein FlhF [Methylomagnum ishizawai]SMF94958.1 flagellar biosynthesis protein FlhF [Methylomagnum ishizawai]